MELGSKHISVPMNANFTENIGGIAKGLNTNNSSNNNNNNNSNNNLNSTSNLPQANFFRPDNHHNIAGQAVSLDGENNSSKKITSNINNNNNNNSSSIIMTSGNNGNSNIGNKNNNGINGTVRYKECLKNHAASKGGYAVDGCGEFMPSGDEGSLEALKCAACGCHRNFHRRETNGGSNSMNLLALPSPISANNTSTSNNEYGEGEPYHHHNNNMGAGAGVGVGAPAGFGHYNTSAASHHHVMGFLPHLHHHHHHQYMHSLMGSKLVQGAHGGHTLLGGHGGGHPYSSGSGGKRFRTKFTMEQREKMFEFSEKVGWRIQKQDEAAVQQFCAEAGVKRHVLKVWMHNNKNTFGKKLLRFPEAFNALPESSS
eukprot:c19423_g1_i1 orf=65-1174(-)